MLQLRAGTANRFTPPPSQQQLRGVLNILKTFAHTVASPLVNDEGDWCQFSGGEMVDAIKEGHGGAAAAHLTVAYRDNAIALLIWLQGPPKPDERLADGSPRRACIFVQGDIASVDGFRARTNHYVLCVDRDSVADALFEQIAAKSAEKVAAFEAQKKSEADSSDILHSHIHAMLGFGRGAFGLLENAGTGALDLIGGTLGLPALGEEAVHMDEEAEARAEAEEAARVKALNAAQRKIEALAKRRKILSSSFATDFPSAWQSCNQLSGSGRSRWADLSDFRGIMGEMKPPVKQRFLYAALPAAHRVLVQTTLALVSVFATEPERHSSKVCRALDNPTKETAEEYLAHIQARLEKWCVILRGAFTLPDDDDTDAGPRAVLRYAFNLDGRRYALQRLGRVQQQQRGGGESPPPPPFPSIPLFDWMAMLAIAAAFVRIESETVREMLTGGQGTPSARNFSLPHQMSSKRVDDALEEAIAAARSASGEASEAVSAAPAPAADASASNWRRWLETRQEKLSDFEKRVNAAEAAVSGKLQAGDDEVLQIKLRNAKRSAVAQIEARNRLAARGGAAQAAGRPVGRAPVTKNVGGGDSASAAPADAKEKSCWWCCAPKTALPSEGDQGGDAGSDSGGSGADLSRGGAGSRLGAPSESGPSLMADSDDARPVEIKRLSGVKLRASSASAADSLWRNNSMSSEDLIVLLAKILMQFQNPTMATPERPGRIWVGAAGERVYLRGQSSFALCGSAFTSDAMGDDSPWNAGLTSKSDDHPDHYLKTYRPDAHRHRGKKIEECMHSLQKECSILLEHTSQHYGVSTLFVNITQALLYAQNLRGLFFAHSKELMRTKNLETANHLETLSFHMRVVLNELQAATQILSVRETGMTLDLLVLLLGREMVFAQVKHSSGDMRSNIATAAHALRTVVNFDADGEDVVGVLIEIFNHHHKLLNFTQGGTDAGTQGAAANISSLVIGILVHAIKLHDFLAAEWGDASTSSPRERAYTLAAAHLFASVFRSIRDQRCKALLCPDATQVDDSLGAGKDVQVRSFSMFEKEDAMDAPMLKQDDFVREALEPLEAAEKRVEKKVAKLQGKWRKKKERRGHVVAVAKSPSKRTSLYGDGNENVPNFAVQLRGVLELEIFDARISLPHTFGSVRGRKLFAVASVDEQDDEDPTSRWTKRWANTSVWDAPQLRELAFTAPRWEEPQCWTEYRFDDDLPNDTNAPWPLSEAEDRVEMMREKYDEAEEETLQAARQLSYKDRRSYALPINTGVLKVQGVRVELRMGATRAEKRAQNLSDDTEDIVLGSYLLPAATMLKQETYGGWFELNSPSLSGCPGDCVRLRFRFRAETTNFKGLNSTDVSIAVIPNVASFVSANHEVASFHVNLEKSPDTLANFAVEISSAKDVDAEDFAIAIFPVVGFSDEYEKGDIGNKLYCWKGTITALTGGVSQRVIFEKAKGVAGHSHPTSVGMYVVRVFSKVAGTSGLVEMCRSQRFAVTEPTLPSDFALEHGQIKSHIRKLKVLEEEIDALWGSASTKSIGAWAATDLGLQPTLHHMETCAVSNITAPLPTLLVGHDRPQMPWVVERDVGDPGLGGGAATFLPPDCIQFCLQLNLGVREVTDVHEPMGHPGIWVTSCLISLPADERNPSAIFLEISNSCDAKPAALTWHRCSETATVIGSQQESVVLTINDEVRHIRLCCRRRVLRTNSGDDDEEEKGALQKETPMRIDAVEFRTSVKKYIKSLFQLEWLRISEDIQQFLGTSEETAVGHPVSIVDNTAAAEFNQLTDSKEISAKVDSGNGAAELFESIGSSLNQSACVGDAYAALLPYSITRKLYSESNLLALSSSTRFANFVLLRAKESGFRRSGKPFSCYVTIFLQNWYARWLNKTLDGKPLRKLAGVNSLENVEYCLSALIRDPVMTYAAFVKDAVDKAVKDPPKHYENEQVEIAKMRTYTIVPADALATLQLYSWAANDIDFLIEALPHLRAIAVDGARAAPELRDISQIAHNLVPLPFSRMNTARDHVYMTTNEFAFSVGSRPPGGDTAESFDVSRAQTIEVEVSLFEGRVMGEKKKKRRGGLFQRKVPVDHKFKGEILAVFVDDETEATTYKVKCYTDERRKYVKTTVVGQDQLSIEKDDDSAHDAAVMDALFEVGKEVYVSGVHFDNPDPFLRLALNANASSMARQGQSQPLWPDWADEREHGHRGHAVPLGPAYSIVSSATKWDQLHPTWGGETMRMRVPPRCGIGGIIASVYDNSSADSGAWAETGATCAPTELRRVIDGVTGDASQLLGAIDMRPLMRQRNEYSAPFGYAAVDEDAAFMLRQVRLVERQMKNKKITTDEGRVIVEKSNPRCGGGSHGMDNAVGTHVRITTQKVWVQQEEESDESGMKLRGGVFSTRNLFCRIRHVTETGEKQPHHINNDGDGVYLEEPSHTVSDLEFPLTEWHRRRDDQAMFAIDLCSRYNINNDTTDDVVGTVIVYKNDYAGDGQLTHVKKEIEVVFKAKVKGRLGIKRMKKASVKWQMFIVLRYDLHAYPRWCKLAIPPSPSGEAPAADRDTPRDGTSYEIKLSVDFKLVDVSVHIVCVNAALYCVLLSSCTLH